VERARIGIDIGGTFTDLVLLDEAGRIFAIKVPSTPAYPEQAVLTGIRSIVAEAGLAIAEISELLHGTTVGSNTLLQKLGAKCGLITTRGFRDVLEIGRVRTPTMFDLSWDKPAPLIARRYRKEIDERITADGRVLKPVREAEILEIGRFFRQEGVESVAICFLNSYRNSENEAVAERIFRENFPDIWITSSTSVLPEIREYERTSTAAVNAYVLPALRGYFERLADGLRALGIAAPLLISNSSGGLSSVRLAQEKPVFFISSGRSAGVVGARALGAAAGVQNLVAFDMGGTTASASLISQGEVSRTNEYEFRAGISTSSRFIKAGGYLMRVPAIDVAEVGSGAGSIAFTDSGGLLRVGPLSAGADPGPVSYGIGGTRPTVTDANAVLGFLPTTLAGGALRLDLEKARSAIDRELARALGLTVEAAAFGVREVANANMARAIKAVTVERGVDPRDFALLAFGGSGPVHACDLARTLGITRVVFPRAPGVFTAMGMLAGNVERYFLRPLPRLLHELSVGDANGIIEALRREAMEAMASEGYGDDRIRFDFEIDLRYRGQDSELPIPLSSRLSEGDEDSLREVFFTAYKATYGYTSSDDVEIVNIRLRASGLATHTLDFASAQPEVGPNAPSGTRRIYFDRDIQWVETPVRTRAGISGEAIGPLVLESPDTTIVIPPGVRVAVDTFGSILADLS
jgi:N-methylhydantoinase A